MKHTCATALAFAIAVIVPSPEVLAQCDDITVNGPNNLATSCQCASVGQTDCDLIPDVMISWLGLQNISSGPSEYSQTASSSAGRLRISGATPNVGFGPLEVRGVRADGYRKFICGPEIDSIYAPLTNPGFACDNGFTPKQILFQRIYHKNGNTMSFNEYERGTMTYHSTHNHYHVNGWTTMTLRLAQPGVTDPTQWPIVASGGKLGFCLTNLYTCSGSPGYCKDDHRYAMGNNILNGYFGNNYSLGPAPGCSDDVQCIQVGKGDIYDEGLDGMWINMMPGLCNGQYHIVAVVDPNNDWIETNENNNWTSLPINLTQQTVANNGGTASIDCNGNTTMLPGDTRVLTASPGTAYLWSTGATSRSITVSAAGNYSCTVTCPCGSLSTPSLAISLLDIPAIPNGTDGSRVGPGTVGLAASGNDLHWFDAATNGTEVGSGPNFTTPNLSSTTSYWVEARNTAPGQNLTVGKAENTTSGAWSSTKDWLFFDVTTPFKLVSFKVRANSTGQRHFVLVDRLGNLIAEKYIEIPSGLNTIEVNWDVPAGTQHRIAAFDDNTEVVRNLWANTSGASYPYPIGTMGSITGCSAGASTYYYLYDWVVRTDEVVAKSARRQVTATIIDPVALSLKVKLDGPFNSGTGLMNDDLRAAGLVPLVEPYSALGYGQVAGGGGESTTAPVLAVTGNDAIVDWVRVELRAQPSPNIVQATRQALLQRDGDIVDMDGISPIGFGVGAGNYFVAVRHRNHLGCMTSTAIALAPLATTLDLGSPATATWGTAARKQVGGTMLLWAGNVYLDPNLKYTGTDNDRDPILVAVGASVPTNTTTGYAGTDVNMDGTIKYTGAGNDRDPILVNIGSTLPTNVLFEQIP